MGIVTDGEKVEVVRLLDQLLSEIRLRLGQSAIKVGDGLSLPGVESAFDLEDKYIAAPAMLQGVLDVPEPLVGSLIISMILRLWPQGICPTTCWTIASSG